jgi:hypothetical protein
MTVTTDAPSAVAGVSAAELATMQDAANVFREQFAGGPGRHETLTYQGTSFYKHSGAADPFGILAQPFPAPPPDARTACIADTDPRVAHFYR